MQEQKRPQQNSWLSVEDVIRKPHSSQSIQSLQLSVDKVKFRLDLAASPSGWSMPSNMVINISSVMEYNNQLRHPPNPIHKSPRWFGVPFCGNKGFQNFIPIFYSQNRSDEPFENLLSLLIMSSRFSKISNICYFPKCFFPVLGT